MIRSQKLKDYNLKRQHLLLRLNTLQERRNILLDHSRHFKENNSSIKHFYHLDNQKILEAKQELEMIDSKIISLKREEQRFSFHQKGFFLALFLSLVIILSSIIVYFDPDYTKDIRSSISDPFSVLNNLLSNISFSSALTGSIVEENILEKNTAPSINIKNKKKETIGEYTLSEEGSGSYNLDLSSEKKDKNGKTSTKSVNVKINGLKTASGSLNIYADNYLGDKPFHKTITTSLLAVEGAEITNATIQLPKTGKVDLILSCNNFDAASFNCLSWEDTNIPFEDKGDYVEFTVTHFSAYAGGEIIAIDAKHLGINYSFISNIYSQVQNIDNVWSEPIYENEFVRVTYEHNLTDGKVIDVLARSNGTIAYFEIYEAGTTHLVGRSGSVDKPEIQYITVNGLTAPTNLFDFKIVKVVQDQQTCLNLCNQDCTENPYEGCSEQCNNSCSDITFNANRTAFLEFDYIHDQAINSTNVNGLVVYGELAIASPRYRTWNSSANDFSAEASALSIGTDSIENITWVVVKGNHERDEFIMGTEDASLDINIQIFNASAGTWGNLLEVTSTTEVSTTREFDIGIEDLSGDALIVYENSASANTNVGWIIWNGTGYSAETNFTHGMVSDEVQWVGLYPQKGTDQIMMVLLNQGNDVYAVLWNGTAFDTSKQIAPNNATTSNLEDNVAFAWEASGQGLLAYGNTSIIEYLTYDTTVGWGSVTTAFSLGGTDGLDALSMCSDPTSDYIGLIWQDSGNDVNALMWNGTGMLTGPLEDATTLANGADNIDTRCEWFNSTDALFGFSDTTRLMDWFTFTKPATWSTSNLTTSTNTTVTFANGSIAGLQFSKHPTTGQLMVLAASTTSSITTIRWDGISFINVTTNPLETTDSVSTAAQQMAMFDWTRFDPAPSVTNINPSGVTYPNTVVGTTIPINATITDNIAVSVVSANITLPNSSIEQITLTDTDSDAIYNNSYTIPSTGSYTIRIIANDTSIHNNINSGQTASFLVSASGDIQSPAVFGLYPSADSNYNWSTVIEIAANATDNSGVSAVLANITLPNGQSTLLNLTNSSDTPQRYNASYNITGPGGTYWITFIANDTYGNINNTERTNFTVNDTTIPSVTSLIPVNGSSVDYLVALEIAANVSDNGPDTVIVNITLPNSTITQLSLSLADGEKYNSTYTPPIRGTYNLTFIANDTAGHTNNTKTTSFYAGYGCTTLTASTTLDRNVTSTGTCFTIGAHNIILDCSGYIINYSTTSAGNGISDSGGYDNITIKNCNIYEGSLSPTNKDAISFSNVVNSTVFNNTIVTIANLSEGIILATSSYNNFTNNDVTVSGATAKGITLTGSKYNSFSNNIILTSGANNNGMSFAQNASYNNVTFNKITSTGSSSEGLYFQDYDTEVYIAYNNITTTSENPISIYCPTNENDPPFALTIYSNILNLTGPSSANDVIYGGGSYSNNITSNVIVSYDTSSGDGIDFTKTNTTPSNNVISNNNITMFNSTGYAIKLSSTNNTILNSNQISVYRGGVYAILVFIASNTLFSNNIINITNTSSAAIYSYSGSNFTVINDQITNFAASALWIYNLNITLINVSFNKSSINFDTGANGTATVQWYLDALVQNSTSPLESANVTTFNVSNVELSSYLTNTSGIIPQQTLTEFWQNNNTKVYQTPHTINTTLTGYTSNSTTVNLTTTNSTSITITLTTTSANTLPTAPTLLSPLNATHITSRTPTFVWLNSTDADGNPINYNIVVDDNSAFNNPEINVTGISPTAGPNTTYLAVTELVVDTTYYWKVRANDSTGYGSFSTTENFTIDSYLALNLSTSTVNFGFIVRGQSNDTTTGNPNPFRAENVGNIFSNVSINATTYFSSVAFPSNYYMFKMRANESGSFNTTSSLMNWTNMSSTTVLSVVDLNWRTINNDFFTDINITAPTDEPAGSKTSTLTFTVSG